MALRKLLAAKAHVDSMTLQARCEYLNQHEPAAFLGPAGVLRFRGASDGRLQHRAACYYWPAQAGVPPRGVVVLVHGQGSFITFEFLSNSLGVGQPKLYQGSWVQELNAAGFSVAGIDNRGCGRSEGLFGYIHNFDELVDDVLEFTQSLAHVDIPGFSGLPTFMLGCSLGGCIALHAALRQPELYSGLVLLAPMLSLDKLKQKGLNPVLTKLAALLNLVIPTWPIVKTSRNTMFPALQADWESNRATYHFDARVRVGVECIRACDEALASMHQLCCPLLAVHSERDDMTDPDGSKLLVATAKSPDKTLQLVNEMWHVLTKEEGNRQLLGQIINWISQRLPPSS